VAAFLLHDPTFPRSVLHCFNRAATLLAKVEAAAERQEPSASLLAIRATVERLTSADIASVIQSGIHDELTRVVNTAASVCDQLNHDFFDPTTEWEPDTVVSSIKRELATKVSVAPSREPEIELSPSSEVESTQSQSQA
jgi:hypothetical protein